MSDSNSILILLIPYFNIAIRSIPIPNAKPLYSFGFTPQFSSTLLFTIPAPKISIQPVPLQSLHPFPPHSKQLQSTSTEGSVNGKKEGRNLTFVLLSNNFFANKNNKNIYKNNLESVAMNLFPKLNSLKTYIQNNINENIKMTGSGSAMFIASDNKSQLENLLTLIENAENSKKFSKISWKIIAKSA